MHYRLLAAFNRELSRRTLFKGAAATAGAVALASTASAPASAWARPSRKRRPSRTTSMC